MAKQICRFLRVMEYVGSREDLALALEKRQVKGTYSFDGKVKIFEGVLGDTAQPVIGQLQLWCMQQIVAASEGQLYPDDDSMRDGYVNAVQEVLQLVMPKSAYEELCKGAFNG